MDTARNFFLTSAKTAIKVICRVFISLLVWRYFVTLFINGDPYFLEVCRYFCLVYPEEGAVSCWMTDEYRLLAAAHREEVLVSYYKWSVIMLDGYAVNLPSQLSEEEALYVVKKSIVIVRSSLALLDFVEWVAFWTQNLYPLMPWSFLYTGDGLYSSAYKSFVRRGLVSCIYILVGYGNSTNVKQEAYNFLLILLLQRAAGATL